jgi:hypothetical protein
MSRTEPELNGATTLLRCARTQSASVAAISERPGISAASARLFAVVLVRIPAFRRVRPM